MDSLRWIATEDLVYGQETVYRVSRRASKLLSGFKLVLSDQVVDDELLLRLKEVVVRCISDMKAKFTICAEMEVLRGMRLTKSDLVKLACSISGCLEMVKYGEPANLYSSDVPLVDAWAKITAMSPGQPKFDEAQTNITLLICNTVLAGSSVVIQAADRRIPYYSRKLNLRGSRFSSKLSWHTNTQLLGACVIARVSKVNGYISVDGIGMVKGTLEANRKLAASRARSLSACHFGASHDCGECGVGMNQCERSVQQKHTNFDLRSFTKG